MEGLIGYLVGLAIGLIGLVVAVYIIAEDGGGCFAFGVAIIRVITTALNASMLVTLAEKASSTQTTEITTVVTTVTPQYGH